jgi:hypothetical protein
MRQANEPARLFGAAGKQQVPLRLRRLGMTSYFFEQQQAAFY